MITIYRIGETKYLLEWKDTDGKRHGEVCEGLDDLQRAVTRQIQQHPIVGWPR